MLTSNTVEIEFEEGKVILIPIRSVAGALAKYAPEAKPLSEIREQVWQEVADGGKIRFFPDSTTFRILFERRSEEWNRCFSNKQRKHEVRQLTDRKRGQADAAQSIHCWFVFFSPGKNLMPDSDVRGNSTP